MSRPPTPQIPSTLIERVIFAHERDGITFAALQSLTAEWPDQLSQTIHSLRDQRLIEARDGRLYPAQRRRRKPEPVAPGFWARLARMFAP